MNRREFVIRSSLAGLCSIASAKAFANISPFISTNANNNALTAALPLEQAFSNPDRQSAPSTLWHWMNGCVTKKGITYDLEAFKNAGIFHVQQFLVGGIEADVTDKNIEIFNQQWNELLVFALDECERLGMTFGTHNCPGWSSSGAPGLLPADSMQQLVWSKAKVSGDNKILVNIQRPDVDKRWDYYVDITTIAIPAELETIALNDVHIIDKPYAVDNSLECNLPAGEWTLLRFGHTTMGKENLTAPISGQGLEVDKMNKVALEKFWQLYPAKIIELAGHHVGKTFTMLEIDSFEAGEQTWTPNMPQDFKKISGYDLLPWLPVFAGFTLENPSSTALFVDDWNTAISTLVSENYYAHLNTLIHQTPGLQFIVEPYGTGHVNFNINMIRGIGDVLMCEFWWGPTDWGWDSINNVASNAYINGKKMVAAEAFTGQPQYAFEVDLFGLKAAGDRAFCAGVNNYYLHTSAHQPWPQAKPGMTMGWWGTQFGPSQLWWEHGAAQWTKYVSRCQLLLQSGLPVVDICLLQDQLSLHNYPDEPSAYKICSATEQEFLQRFDVANGKWLLPDGLTFELLVLPANYRPGIAAANKILALVTKGGRLLVSSYGGANGLYESDHKSGLQQFESQIYRNATTPLHTKQQHHVGQGKVYMNYAQTEVLESEGVLKDFESADKSILWRHRTEGNSHYYFIANQQPAEKSLSLTFRVSGLQPECWNPETGKIEKIPFYSSDNSGTTVEIKLEAIGSRFIVFRQAPNTDISLQKILYQQALLNPLDHYTVADGKPLVKLKYLGQYQLVFSDLSTTQVESTFSALPLVCNDNWQVSFEPDKGAPDTITLKQLIPLNEHPQAGVKYYSGTASYQKDILLPATFFGKDKLIYLDLGEVKNTASLIINGLKVQTMWKPPFALEISQFCKVGQNSIVVQVTNLWPNRMIGDKFAPETEEWGPVRTFTYVTPHEVIGRNLLSVPEWVINGQENPNKDQYTFCTLDLFNRDTPLLASGLIGPVSITCEACVPV